MIVDGTTTLAVKLGSRVEPVTFKVVEILSKKVLLGCDFFDKHVETICSSWFCVSLDFQIVVPIVRVSNHRQDVITLLEEQELFLPNNSICKKVFTAQLTVLRPSQQIWVTVKYEAAGLVIIETNGRLFDNQMCLAAAGVDPCTSNVQLCILVANSGYTNQCEELSNCGKSRRSFDEPRRLHNLARRASGYHVR